MSASEFAELLRELKERSGLSYGTLAKRLHMSTSTLHRYCNGDAIPTDYAPVERLARLCKASPQELVDLHRRWVLADAGRGRKTAGAAEGGAAEGGAAEGGAAEGGAGEGGAAEGGAVETVVVETGGVDAVVEETVLGEATVPEGDGAVGGEEIGPPRPARTPRPARRVRRSLVLAGVGVVAALGSVALVLSLTLPSDASGEGGGGGAAAAGESVQGKGKGSVSPSPSASVSASASASAAVRPSGSASASGTASRSAAAPGAGSEMQADDSVPLTVNTRPYAWVDPCSQHYLIRSGPDKVAPPPVEQDAPAWVSAHGAVSAGEQFLEITVQGTGAQTVVVDKLTVRTVGKGVPLAWNDYAMGYPGVGCGGGVLKRAFSVALDAARPALVPEAGHQDFPFTVSESDPEVYYVTADASAYDVRWYLELSWSSGSRHGTVTIDDEGKPFRTSGSNGRPDYEFPLGGSAWQRAGASPAS
ncbi:helix-turn-helix domain-containing protein [Streptomyces sp. NY05-11A]|uniref:helix-turn-helix domain-containing protein n=1 Tax=Streptomyces soliscabiei TaxID=588897 RepID=UPI0029B5754C|nr:helix-turn-helix transcriptional regulator [Streptomyces sp. NY05-11A]MDX2682690.1 helix-turn-helix transcriptional regulator [Streptomyces sp. NY05-11A]